MAVKSRHTGTRRARSKPQQSLKQPERRPSPTSRLLATTEKGLDALRARLETPRKSTKGADGEKRRMSEALKRLRADYERLLKGR